MEKEEPDTPGNDEKLPPNPTDMSCSPSLYEDNTGEEEPNEYDNMSVTSEVDNISNGSESTDDQTQSMKDDDDE